MAETTAPGRTVWGMNGYQWLVVFAAWLGWGFDVFDGLLFNFVAPNAVPTLLDVPIGSARGQEGHPPVDRVSHRPPADRLGDWRRPVRPARGPDRPHQDADADDAALRRRDGALRARAEHLDAGVLPTDRQPRHRRRVGRRRGDGRGDGAGEAANRGGRAALHVGADRLVPRGLCELPDRRRVDAGFAGDIVALGVRVRPAAGRRRAARPRLREGA